jgi:hypothetical protein
VHSKPLPTLYCVHRLTAYTEADTNLIILNIHSNIHNILNILNVV